MLQIWIHHAQSYFLQIYKIKIGGHHAHFCACVWERANIHCQCLFSMCARYIYLVHKKLCAAMMHNAKQGNNLKGQSCCFYFTIQILQQCV